MTAHIMTRDAGAISIRAFAHAARLGHPYLGGEHYLLALAAAAQPAGAVLREHGVTPERVESEIVRLSGAGLFGDLDRDALTTVGIDVDAVRAATEASFGRATLARAARDVHRGPGRFSPRRRSGATRGTGSSCRTAPASTRPWWVPAARPRPGTQPRRMSSTSHWASSPSARDWCPRSCRGSARPGRH